MIVNRSEAVIGRIVLIAVLILTLVPLANMVSAALQPADRNPTGLTWPTDPQWGNFVEAFQTGHVVELMSSSALIVLGVVPLSILLFLWTWNQFLLPVVLISDPLKRTVAGSLTYFQGQYSTSIPLLNAGALIIIAPAILVFLVFQRQFIKALLQGAVKG